MTMLKQVFIVNSDLKMRKGKIAVQVAHGEVEYMRNIKLIEEQWHANRAVYACAVEQMRRYDMWYEQNNHMMKKVVLTATHKQIHEFMNMFANQGVWHHDVHDRGLTQVDAGSLTCLVFEPLREDVCDKLFGNLKLL